MNKHLSASVEDYLKAIYDLTREQGRAATNEIAERDGRNACLGHRHDPEAGRHAAAPGRLS